MKPAIWDATEETSEDRGKGLFLRFTPVAMAWKDGHGAAHPTDIYYLFLSFISSWTHIFNKNLHPIIIKL